MKKSDLLINTNGYVLSLLEKILDANIELKGIENIPKNHPRLFVANHFTRSEAMLVPYSLYNLTGKKVGVIADDSLFKTYFGEFLENLGAMPKSDPRRNNHIIGDLITSCKDWMIFPEGRMVKAKDIEKIDNNFCVKIDGACQRIYTGATYFALYSQLLRQDYFNYKIKNFKKFQRKYFVNDCSDINKNETMIIPINISYTNLRSGKNFLIEMAEKLVDIEAENFKEELEIESNIILNSKMTIQILEPVSTKDILEEAMKFSKNHNKIIDNIRYELTHSFMNKVYESTTINFDHIFILALYLIDEEKIDMKYFKRIIYLAIRKLVEHEFYYDENIDKELTCLIAYEKQKAFEEVFELALRDGIIYIKDDEYYYSKETLENLHTHNSIRLKNILGVILNEVLINEKLINLIKSISTLRKSEIDNILIHQLEKEENEDFLESQKLYWYEKDSTSTEVGQAKWYDKNQTDTCVINIHGFSASPKEMEELSLHLEANSLNVYAPRLSGHGTNPKDLKNKTWQDWYKSVSRAITIASIKYKRVFIVGFSTGGLLALLSSRKNYDEFAGIVCINAALNLNDIRMKTLLPAVSVWNDLVQAFSDNTLSYDYIDNNAEFPETNYDKYYVESIEQLSKLMKKTKKHLEHIDAPILIIQGENDPVVNTSSAYEIFNNIKSEKKVIDIVEGDNHVIVKGENTQNLFECILKFIKYTK